MHWHATLDGGRTRITASDITGSYRMPLQHDHIAELAAQGPEAWNAWAEPLLAERRALEAAGAWQLETGPSEIMIGANGPTRDWLHRSRVNAQNYRLPTPLRLAGMIIPGEFDLRGASGDNLDCSETIFHGPVLGHKAQLANASFKAARFLDRVMFEDAVFGADVDFSTAAFKATAWFQGATFQRASFYHSEAEDSVHFNGAVFGDYVNIEWSTFHGLAAFSGATFRGGVTFLTTQMDHAAFDGATFSDGADFRDVVCDRLDMSDARMAGLMDFRGLTVTSDFSMRSAESKGTIDFSEATFGTPPDFTFTTLRCEIRLDNLTVRRSWLGFYVRPQSGYDATMRPPRRFGIYLDENAPAKFRALRKIAASGNDVLRELSFHAGEIRSSRFVTDWPLPWWGKPLGGFPRFWAGVLYGALSDYGRSIFRPFAWWVLLSAACAGLYLSYHPAVRANADTHSVTDGGWIGSIVAVRDAVRSGEPCLASTSASVTSTDAATEALQLAASNATVFGDSGADTNKRAFGCLYGFDSGGGVIVPTEVSWIARVQRVLSAVLLFLFGLGLRNMLRMK